MNAVQCRIDKTMREVSANIAFDKAMHGQTDIYQTRNVVSVSRFVEAARAPQVLTQSYHAVSICCFGVYPIAIQWGTIDTFCQDSRDYFLLLVFDFQFPQDLY